MQINIHETMVDEIFEKRMIEDIQYLRKEIARKGGDEKELKKMLKGAKQYAQWSMTTEGRKQAFKDDVA